MIQKPARTSLLYAKLLIFSFLFFPLSLLILFLSLASLAKGRLFITVASPRSPEVLASEIEPLPATPTLLPEKISPSEDIRVSALKKFFSGIDSPLYAESETLVKEADLNNLDYRLIPAISMQESNGCKKIPEGSHNCWGYGIYGKKITKFDSLQTAIEKVAKTLKDSYQDNGLTNATLVEDKWTPQSEGEWSYGVNTYLGKIREYEKSLSHTTE